MQYIHFAQQSQILQAALILVEIWGDFQSMWLRVEIPIPSVPIIHEEWAIHHCHFQSPIIIPIRVDMISGCPPHAPADYMDPWELDPLPPDSEEPPTEEPLELFMAPKD